MQVVTPEAAQTDFIVGLLESAHNSSVVIRDKKNERDCAVVMSVGQYEDYRKMRVESLINFADECAEEAANNGMTPEILEQLLAEED